jgi:exosome complex RNA-binding protein Rrp4
VSNKPNIQKEKPVSNVKPAIQIFVGQNGEMHITHPNDVMATVGILLRALDAVVGQKMVPKESLMVEVVPGLVDIPSGMMGRG